MTERATRKFPYRSARAGVDERGLSLPSEWLAGRVGSGGGLFFASGPFEWQELRIQLGADWRFDACFTTKPNDGSDQFVHLRGAPRDDIAMHGRRRIFRKPIDSSHRERDRIVRQDDSATPRDRDDFTHGRLQA